MDFPVLSADAHITEPPNTYLDHIDAKWRDKASRLVHMDGVGDVFQIDGLPRPIPMGLVAAAGKPAHEIRDAHARGRHRSSEVDRGARIASVVAVPR